MLPHQSERGDKKNLARFMVESIENISCYDQFDVMALTTLCLHTNWENRLVYESREYLLNYSKMKKSNWSDRIKWMEMDGLIKRLISRSQLMHQSLQQNYQILIPDKKFSSCEYWPEHYINGSHDLRVTRSKRKKDKEIEKAKNALLQEHLNELYEEQVRLEKSYEKHLRAKKDENLLLHLSGLITKEEFFQEFGELPL